MPTLPPDHPGRLALSNEVHARPPQPLETPARASCLAVLIDVDARERELAHITTLCTNHGVNGPPDGATQFSATLGTMDFKWERHGEFSTYAVFISGSSVSPFKDTAASRLTDGWLADVPGTTLMAAHAKVMAAPAGAPSASLLTAQFDGNIVLGSFVGEGAAIVYTDFRVHADGFARFVVFDVALTPRQAGRIVQRLFEIETYRMLALLALPIARQQMPRIVEIESALAELTGRISQDQHSDDESLLRQLTRLAAEVERLLVSSQFRFGACRAYVELVTARIDELREQRLVSVQTIEEFMSRRFTPAVATCTTASQRLHDLSERVAQTSALLSTRVDIARERQNQALLASMDRRAKLQLRLQQTVEGLSVAAIVYYVAGLVGYGATAVRAAGVNLNVDITVGVAIPLVALFVISAIRRTKRRIARSEAGLSTREL